MNTRDRWIKHAVDGTITRDNRPADLTDKFIKSAVPDADTSTPPSVGKNLQKDGPGAYDNLPRVETTFQDLSPLMSITIEDVEGLSNGRYTPQEILRRRVPNL